MYMYIYVYVYVYVYVYMYISLAGAQTKNRPRKMYRAKCMVLNNIQSYGPESRWNPPLKGLFPSTRPHGGNTPPTAVQEAGVAWGGAG